MTNNIEKKTIDGWQTVIVSLGKSIKIPVDVEEGKPPAFTEIKTLTFIEPDVDKLDAIATSPGFQDDETEPTIGEQIKVFSVLCDEHDENVLKKMHPSDFGEVAKAIVPLLEEAMATLASSSETDGDKEPKADKPEPVEDEIPADEEPTE